MLLLLAGTSEAREIASVLAAEKIPAMATLAERDPNARGFGC